MKTPQWIHPAQIWLFLLQPTLAGESLYNGIELPAQWPPVRSAAEVTSLEPMPVPYLEKVPAIIPVDVGRQLLVDDFLIESTTLRRRFHSPDYHKRSPVLRPEKEWEKSGSRAFAAPYSDGVWYDPQERVFKMWYRSAFGYTCLALSNDGIKWTRPALELLPGSNVVLKSKRDAATVLIDDASTDPEQRFKLFAARTMKSPFHLALRGSAEGRRWSEELTVSGPSWDRSTVFWNPFREVWVASVRGHDRMVPEPVHRIRNYHEGKTAAAALGWTTPTDQVAQGRFVPGDLQPWVAADRLDPRNPDPRFRDIEPQLYNLDVFPYESLMVGLFTLWQGPDNETCKELGIHKRNEVLVGFSRDGFHWDRKNRERFLPVSEDPNDWNAGNVQSVGGGCTIVGDRLFFYCSGRTMQPSNIASTGLATLRRDGFASLDAGATGGSLTTRPMVFSGRHLFVNVAAPKGELRADVLDVDGEVIAPFTKENSVPMAIDSTRVEMRWRSTTKDLSGLVDRPVRLRFHLKNGSLYSFWISPTARGASRGYVAAGGPEFTSNIDTGSDPDLPRVLLIGDSISGGYQQAVSANLKGKVTVTRITGNGQSTRHSLTRVDEQLKNGKWAVIHFNWGLWDMRHKIEKDGRLSYAVPIEEYKANLLKLLAKMKPTGAKLVWANTTPVAWDEPGNGRTNPDVIRYNQAAMEIMKKNGVAIDDLYTAVKSRLGELQTKKWPSDVHFTEEGYRVLSRSVADSVLAALSTNKTPSPREAPGKPPFRASDTLFDLSDKQSLGLKPIAGEHVDVFRASEKMGYRFSHHPSLAVFQDQLICMWSNGFHSEDRPGQRVLFSQSADGKNWSEPSVLASPGEKDAVCVAAGFHIGEERIVAYFSVAHYPTHNLMRADTSLFAVTSVDGQDWSEPRRVCSGFFISGPLKLPGGRLLMAGEQVGEAWKNNQERMRLIYSDQEDGLGAWKESAISPADPKVFGYTEPSPFIRRDGALLTPFRNTSGYLYASISRDRGESWSVPVKTNYPDSMARSSAGRLPDGSNYLINNPGPGNMNRSLLAIGLSRDGKLFDRAWLVRGDPTTQRFNGKGKLDGWQYPDSFVWKDALWIVYSANKEDIVLTRVSLDQFDNGKTWTRERIIFDHASQNQILRGVIRTRKGSPRSMQPVQRRCTSLQELEDQMVSPGDSPGYFKFRH